MATVDDEQRCKVVRQLNEFLPRAAHPQPSGVSFDLRLYLREDSGDGHFWAGVSFIDRQTGQRIESEGESTIPLADPPSVGWFFEHIADKGFPLAQERRTKPRR